MNPKFIAYAACVGFVLSFIIGLVAGHAFGTVIAKAFVSAFGVALVFFLGNFVYKKFLYEVIEDNSTFSDEEASVSLEEQIDEPLEEKDAGDVFQYEVLTEKQKNQEATLASDESQTLTEKKDGQQTESVAERFSPMPLTTVVSEQKSEEKSSSVVVLDEELENLEELPDISSNPVVLTENSIGEPLVEDTDNTESTFRPAPVETIAQNGDASLMASAIRTLLANDD
ncbi:MAG: hypothetical protein E7062_03490 [Spirochaetaceae bacterium]|nr:hypothetical protein [Spirochaetaceae bacterium]